MPEPAGGGFRDAPPQPLARAHGSDATDAAGDAMLESLVIVLALILANGLFSGAEIAVLTVRKSRLQELVESGRRGAKVVLSLRENPERFLATVQVGITLIGITAGAFGEAALTAPLTGALERSESLRPYASQIAFGLVVGGITYLSVVIGELVPKSLALRAAERYALAIGRPMVVLSWLAAPVTRLLAASSNAVLRPFGDRTSFTEGRHSPEELQQLLRDSAQSGALHPEASAIAERAIDLPGLSAADVMIPRQRVVMLRRGASADELRRVLLEHTHTRMPVYEGNADNVVGYVSVKDLLSVAWEQRLIVLEDVIRPPFFVPETQPAVDLLQDMRARRTPFAIVVDEQGGLSGIVTMEDLVEELVGEIFSEHGQQPVPPPVREEDGSATVAGELPIREVNRDLGLDLPEYPGATTVAGLCLEVAGRIPPRGESLELPDGTRLEVVEATARRVARVRIRPAPQRSDREDPPSQRS